MAQPAKETEPIRIRLRKQPTRAQVGAAQILLRSQSEMARRSEYERAVIKAIAEAVPAETQRA